MDWFLSSFLTMLLRTVKITYWNREHGPLESDWVWPVLHDSSSPNPLLIFITNEKPSCHENFPRHRIAKPAKNFPHYKTNGAERQIAIMIYNDTCAAVLGRTSPLARRMVGDALFFPHRLQSDPQILARRATENWRAISPLGTHIYFDTRKRIFVLLSLCYYSLPHPTSTHYIFHFIELNSKASLILNWKEWQALTIIYLRVWSIRQWEQWWN